MTSRQNIRHLWHDIRVLGPRLGYRYWKIRNHYEAHPEHVLNWVEACEQKADQIASEKPLQAWCLRDWAKRLRKFHTAKMQTQQG